MLTHQEQEKIFAGLLKRKENAFCAECGCKSPCWASLEFGVFVCLNCSGAHRALSPSVTRVKSIRLDSWNRDWLENMQLGNTNINTYWEHLLSDNHGAKPNENSTIDFLIKFVRDKYVRKLYVDSRKPMDPLSRFKMIPNCKPEAFLATNVNSNESPNKEKPPTQSPKPTKLHKAVTINAPMSAVVSKKKDKQADFSFFDDIMINKKPNQTTNPQTNLISFEEAPSVDKKKGFDGFQFKEKPKEEKYNKQQFMSMGGIKPNNPKPEANFDFFPSNPKSSNNIENLINFQSEKVVSKNSFNEYNLPQKQYNKAQFASMGGNNPNSGFKPNVNNAQMNFGQFNTNVNGQINNTNWFGNNYLGGELQKHKMPPRPPPQHITLEANISFDVLGKEKKVSPEITSWVDQWK